MKRFVICLDGTWQKLRQEKLTNIGVIARSVAHTATAPDGVKTPQTVIYSQGVGANTDALGARGFISGAQAKINKLAGGIFGEGLEDGIMDTYLRLAFNWEAGDEIYIFGFSRGAFAARSLAGLINCSGIVSRMHADKAWEAFRLYRTPPPKNATEDQLREHAEERAQFRRLYGKGARNPDGTRRATDEPPPITYLGIFDTVGQRGVPEAFGFLNKLFNKRYGFHNLSLGANVQAARHAVAVDENRFGFPPTLWDNLPECNARAGRKVYLQRWFVGTHGDVGGGNGSPLSAPPLKWIAEGATEAGLRFYGVYGEDESPLHATLRDAGLSFEAKIARPSLWRSLSPMNYAVGPRKIWRSKEKPSQADAEEHLDETVAMRAMAARVLPPYKPQPLRPFEAHLREIALRRLPPDELRELRKRWLPWF